MKLRSTCLAGLLLAGFLCTGLAAQTATPAPAANVAETKAKDLDVAKDVCALCQMKVDSLQWAAQANVGGTVLFYDDLGCLLKHQAAGFGSDKKADALFVRTVDGKNWVALAKALFALDKDTRTPMGYGFHAFLAQADLEAFKKTHAKAVQKTLDELAKIVKETKMGKM